MTPPLTVAMIQARVARHYAMPVETMLSRSRKHAVASKRQVAMFLARNLTDFSRPQIARRFGRDPSTLIHAERAVVRRARTDRALARDLAWLASELRPGLAGQVRL